MSGTPQPSATGEPNGATAAMESNRPTTDAPETIQTP